MLSMQSPKTPKTPASSQVFDLFFSKSKRFHDSVACSLSELPGQAIVAEDLQDLHWTALDGLQCASTSGNGPPSQQNHWKIRDKILQIDVSFWKIYVIFSSGSKMPPDTQLRQNVSKLGKFTAKMSGACSWPSGASTPPNLRHVKKFANVRRIGTLTDRDTDLRFGEHFGIFDEF